MENQELVSYIRKKRVSFTGFVFIVLKRVLMMLTGRKHEPVTPPQLNIPGNPENPKGWVLISYIAEVYLRDRNDPWIRGHANRERALIISGIFQKFGYAVDVIDCNDLKFVPKKKYDILFGQDPAFPVLAKMMPDAIKIFYSTALPEVQYNDENARRFSDLKKRRRIRLKPSTRKIHDSYQLTDWIFYIGNRASYTHFSKYEIDVLKILHVSTGRNDHIEINPEAKDKNAIKNFLYVGSWNPVNRGLDRVLEVFAKKPDLNLIVCTDLLYNSVFAWKFKKELFFTPNILTMGFVDTGSELFRSIVKACAWQIYPSGSEAAASSVVLGIRSGLVPIISNECALDIGGHGWILPDCSVETIERHVSNAAEMSYPEWLKMSKSIKEYASDNYSIENFEKMFTSALSSVLGSRDN